MRIKTLLLATILFSVFNSFKAEAQPVNTTDSLALVDLYNSTNGPGWINHTNWLTQAPVSSWFGVFVDAGRVYMLILSDNKLSGSLPSSLANLTGLQIMEFKRNQLTGSIPSSYGTFPTIFGIDVGNNQLSGPLPNSLGNLPIYTVFTFIDNNFTFDGLEYLINRIPITHHFIFCAPQEEIPLRQNGNTLSVSAGGTPSRNTYRWYNDDVLVATISGDSNYTFSTPGNYSVEVTNNIVSGGSIQLLLYSYSKANIQDSLALVDFYNNTNGSGWVNNYNWLTNAPLCTWYGVTVRRGRVIGIEMPYNNLSGSIPASMGNLSGLKEIILNNNQLNGNIPSNLSNINNLVNLAFSHNQFSGEIPFSFGSMSNLINLDLSFNQLSGNIPLSICNLGLLTGLRLNDNQLTGNIPDSIGKFSQLNYLFLQNNQLSGVVPATINNLIQLKDLSLKQNRFTFSGLEQLPLATDSPVVYSPQANIPLNRNGNSFSVSAGGTLANDTFRLYKDGLLSTTHVGDSTFSITAPGQYYITVTNRLATKLTLMSDTSTIAGLVLADTTSTIMNNIGGLTPVDITDSPYHKLILTITPGPGANAVSGNVIFKVIIDTAVTSFNNQPYVQRHYDITPLLNPSVSTAMVKLYFTQQDFNNFNASPAHGLDLPTGPGDASGIANLRVYQYHGFSTTSLPGTYSGGGTEINPDDTNIVWNATSQYWEVSFAVNGFSGFFISSLNSALLPLKLLSFTGKMQGNQAMLQWVTEKEVNTKFFELERSIDGITYRKITQMAAAGISNKNRNYQFADQVEPSVTYYYRLRMVDIDGKSAYSNIVKLYGGSIDRNFSVYPNPAHNVAFIDIPMSRTNSSLIVTDAIGRTVEVIEIPKGVVKYELKTNYLPKGRYTISWNNGGNLRNIVLVIQ